LIVIQVVHRVVRRKKKISEYYKYEKL
jgi:hypothetical protein